MKTILRIGEVLVVFALGMIGTVDIPIHKGWSTVICLLLYIGMNLLPSKENRQLPTRRLRICADGCELLIIFLISTILSIVYLLVRFKQPSLTLWLWNIAAVVVVEAIVFWNGIVRVYLTSGQLGMKWRIIGIVCGWLPIAHIYALYHILQIAKRETVFESERIWRNEKRKNQQICKTKYPLLLVHGVFFRDFQYFNYWGRIPKELEANGATIYYGNHQSAAAVADSGKELALRIQMICQTQGCEKVHIIAHSKGGLDARYAISKLAMAPYVASLTTINTPHRGCVFADYLLHKIPEAMKQKVASAYNAALKKLGDEDPDFLSAVNDLTASACKQFNEEVIDQKGVLYQSVGSLLNHPQDGRFPLNFSTRLVSYFDGVNDGLVADVSFPWGSDYTLLTTKGNRGISHGDMIDLNRENIADFDVREFYVQLVHKLKEQGL